MFNIDWANVAKQITEALQINNVKTTILKMKADIYLLNVANGYSPEDAWKIAEDRTKFFEEKISGTKS